MGVERGRAAVQALLKANLLALRHLSFMAEDIPAVAFEARGSKELLVLPTAAHLQQVRRRLAPKTRPAHPHDRDSDGVRGVFTLPRRGMRRWHGCRVRPACSRSTKLTRLAKSAAPLQARALAGEFAPSNKSSRRRRRRS